MKLFNKQQIAELDSVNFSNIHKTIVESNYAVGINCRFTNVVTSVYKQVSQEKLQNWSCNSCCFNNIKKVGRLYNQSIKALEAEQQPEQQETIINPQPKKRGRPKQTKQ